MWICAEGVSMLVVMPLKTSDEKQDLILKVFDYFEAESKLSLGESEMNI
jgi:hypothetical protein